MVARYVSEARLRLAKEQVWASAQTERSEKPGKQKSALPLFRRLAHSEVERAGIKMTRRLYPAIYLEGGPELAWHNQFLRVYAPIFLPKPNIKCF